MRKLNKKQKEILKKWLRKELKNKEHKSSLTIHFDVEHDLPYSVYEEVKDLNDFETFNQEVNNYIVDLIMK